MSVEMFQSLASVGVLIGSVLGGLLIAVLRSRSPEPKATPVIAPSPESTAVPDLAQWSQVHIGMLKEMGDLTRRAARSDALQEEVNQLRADLTELQKLRTDVVPDLRSQIAMSDTLNNGLRKQLELVRKQVKDWRDASESKDALIVHLLEQLEEADIPRDELVKRLRDKIERLKELLERNLYGTEIIVLPASV